MRIRLRKEAVLALAIFAASSAAKRRTDASAWPDIPAADLTATGCPGNSNASAAILDYEVTTDDIMHFEDHSESIKICSPKGRHYGDVQIIYNPGFWGISHIRARTLEPNGRSVPFTGKVYQTKVIKVGRYKEFEKTLALPDVEVGDVIQVYYQLDWERDLPGVFKNPGDYEIFAPSEFNTVRWRLVHRLFVRHEVFTWRPVGWLLWYVRGLDDPPGTKIQRLTDGRRQIVLDDVMPNPREPHAPPNDPLGGHVDFFYYLVPPGTRHSTADQFAESFWSGQGKLIAGDFRKFIGGSGSLRKEAKKIAANEYPPMTRLEKLYDRTQQIRNLDFEPEKTEKELEAEKIEPNLDVKNVLRHGYGSGYDINALFAALARGAGFEAHFVTVADVESGPFDKKYTIWSQLSDQIVGVTVGKQQLYFDPATKYCPFGLLPWDEAAVRGFALDKKRGVIPVVTPLPVASDAVTDRTADFQVGPDGTLTGTLTVVFHKQEALQLRLLGNNKDETARAKILKDRIKRWLPSDAQIGLTGSTNWDGERAITAAFKISIPHFAAVAGGNLIFPMDVLDWNDANPFTDPTRVYPIYYAYPFEKVDDVAFHLPDGFTVNTLPASKDVPTRIATYQSSYQQRGNAIQYHREFSILYRFIPAADYAGLKGLYDAVRSSDGQMVVAKPAKGTN